MGRTFISDLPSTVKFLSFILFFLSSVFTCFYSSLQLNCLSSLPLLSLKIPHHLTSVFLYLSSFRKARIVTIPPSVSFILSNHPSSPNILFIALSFFLLPSHISYIRLSHAQSSPPHHIHHTSYHSSFSFSLFVLAFTKLTS